MDPEFQEIEDTLKALRPSAPDAACHERLLMAVERRVPSFDMVMERQLAGMRPVAPGDASVRKMLETVSRVPFPVDEKVVLFPGASKPAKAPARRNWIAAAAAVAVAGAFSALMIDGPAKPVRAPVAEASAPVRSHPVNPSGIVSAGSGLKDARDEGVIWSRDGRPHRMVRVIYRDIVKYRNDKGEIIEVEVPREEYLMVPEKID